MWLSVDPGFTRLGFALWNKDKLINSGVTGPGERQDGEAWASYWERGIEHFGLWFKTHKITHMVAEKLPPISASGGFASSPQVPLVFGALSTIRWICFEKKIKVDFVASQHWKSVYFDDLKISKAQTRRKIVELYPTLKNNTKLGDIPFDQTDAIALGLSWIKEYGIS